MSRLSWMVLLSGCAAGPDFHDRALATIPEGVRVDVPVAFSRDGRHCAYAERGPGGGRAVRGGWRSKPFDSL